MPSRAARDERACSSSGPRRSATSSTRSRSSADIRRARPGTRDRLGGREAASRRWSRSDPRLRRVDPGRAAPLAARAARARRRGARSARFARDAAPRRATTAILDLQEQVKGALIARLGARTPPRLRPREHPRAARHARSTTCIIASPRDLHFVDRCRAARRRGARLSRSTVRRAGTCASPHTAPAMPDGRTSSSLHATSRDDKLWPEAHWRALIDALRARRLRDACCRGAAPPRKRAAERLAARHRAARSVPAWLSLPRCRSAARARASSSSASTPGFTHLAAALGTPTVALFTVDRPDARTASRIAGAHAPRSSAASASCRRSTKSLRAAGERLRATPRC